MWPSALVSATPREAAPADIDGHDPDVMLWLGDNIYADTDDMAEMRSIYDRLTENVRF